MYQPIRQLGAAAVIAIAASSVAIAGDDDSRGERDAYTWTTVVSNIAADITASPAMPTDPVLQNAWGIAFSTAGSPFWVNDNATGCSTLYDGAGKTIPLQVSIPLPSGIPATSSCKPNPGNLPPNLTPAAPTGIVWNPGASFLVPDTGNTAAFIFATEDGTISAWAGGKSATLAADNSSKGCMPGESHSVCGSVYKGLAFGVNAHGAFLFATDFRNGKVDVFQTNPLAPGSTQAGLFQPATTLDGDFSDPRIPTGYAPFNIVNIDGDLFVTYAKQNNVKHDDVAGPGNGFVDVFDTDGHLLRHFEAGGKLNSPWGITRASFAFGPFSGKILVGNFGDGRVNVFNNDGTFVDQLEDVHGQPLVIDGLWTLTLGGGRNSSPDTVYFAAGPNGETNGLFGTITPAP